MLKNPLGGDHPNPFLRIGRVKSFFPSIAQKASFKRLLLLRNLKNPVSFMQDFVVIRVVLLAIFTKNTSSNFFSSVLVSR